MTGHTISQFLFPYQRSFAASLRYAAKAVFELIGADEEPVVFLVGIAWPAIADRHGICVEPEDGPWSQGLFTATPETLDGAWKAHPSQRMFYGDDASMRDKPENIRRQVVREAVAKDLEGPSRAQGLRSFVSRAHRIAGYYVVAVIQVTEALLGKHPPVSYEWEGEKAEGSFLHDCIKVLLTHAERMFEVPEPGRFSDNGLPRPAELVRRAAQNFMLIPFLEGSPLPSGLFEKFNALSKLMYEGAKGRGRMMLAQRDEPSVEYVLKLAEPVPLSSTRWARKLLQLAADDMPVVIDREAIHGLGRPLTREADFYFVEFLDQQHWDFRRGAQVLLRTRFGEPQLPQETIGEARFLDNFGRIFPNSNGRAGSRFLAALDQLVQLNGGSSLVVAEDAVAEAERLERQGTRVVPTPLTHALLERASRIDGTIICDPDGVCHAIGVILDGTANDACTPSRGARYNSAVRYVSSTQARRLAIIVSEDRTLDVIPLLRPRVSVSTLETLVQTLEASTAENYHSTRNRLHDLRFYLNRDQCERVNAALKPLDDETMKSGRIVWRIPPFTPNDDMNPEYLLV